MKSLSLLEINLISLTERKAKKVNFHPKTTIILGANDTGKSCLIKSIYWTFGTEIKSFDDNWKNAKVISFIRFSLNDIIYGLLRNNRHFSVFDEQNNLIETFDSVTKGIGIYLANLFNFQIVINDRENRPIIPPPAYQLLPFYIDQDTSWSNSWSSFDKLSQLPNWKKSIIEYHTGIHPNEYYTIKSEIDNNKQIVLDLDKEQKIVNGLLYNLRNKLANIQFDIDIESFKSEIKRLLIDCEKLKLKQNDFKTKLLDLYTAKIQIETQINITKKAFLEISRDYKYALESYDDNIECPICGAEYENSLSERFSISQDENRCHELFLELRNELKDVDLKIKHETDKLNSNIVEVENIEKILEIKQGEIKLNDVIESKGKQKMRDMLISEIDNLENQIVDKKADNIKLERKLKLFENKAHKNKITVFYLNLIEKYLKELEVINIPEKSYNKLNCSIKKSGSTKPRALLAYYFSILHVMQKFGSSTYFPIIIDEPDQQGQDELNMPNVLSFIKDYVPSNSQIIIGLINDYGVSFEGEIINSDTKYSILQEDEFELVYKDVMPLLTKISNKGQKTLFDNLIY
jgi:hypothetical protein